VSSVYRSARRVQAVEEEFEAAAAAAATEAARPNSNKLAAMFCFMTETRTGERWRALGMEKGCRARTKRTYMQVRAIAEQQDTAPPIYIALDHEAIVLGNHI